MILIQLQKNNSKHSLMNEQKEKLNLGLYILCNKVELGPWSLPAYKCIVCRKHIKWQLYSTSSDKLNVTFLQGVSSKLDNGIQLSSIVILRASEVLKKLQITPFPSPLWLKHPVFKNIFGSKISWVAVSVSLLYCSVLLLHWPHFCRIW